MSDSNIRDTLGERPPAPRRRFFRPLTCGIGCGAVLLLAVIGIIVSVYWFTKNVLSTKQADIAVLPVTAAEKASALAKAKLLLDPGTTEVIYTERDMNALLQSELHDLARTEGGDAAQYRGHIDLEADDRVRLQISIPVKKLFGGATSRYLNATARFTPVIRDGELALDHITEARTGSVEGKFWFMIAAGVFAHALQAVPIEADGQERDQELQAALARVESIMIEDDRMIITLSPQAP